MKVGKITKAQILTLERRVRRESDIENGIKPMGHAVHKSKKQYNRKEAKKVTFD